MTHLEQFSCVKVLLFWFTIFLYSLYYFLNTVWLIGLWPHWKSRKRVDFEKCDMKWKGNILDFALFLGLRSHLSQFGTCDVLASTEAQDDLWDFLKLIIKRQVTLTVKFVELIHCNCIWTGRNGQIMALYRALDKLPPLTVILINALEHLHETPLISLKNFYLCLSCFVIAENRWKPTPFILCLSLLLSSKDNIQF